MRILITGSPKWDNPDIVYQAIFTQMERANGTPCVIVHGAGSTGVDYYASCLAKDIENLIDEPHAADRKQWGRKASYIRNRKLLKSDIDVCLAFPEPGCKEVWDCINKAKIMGIPVHVYNNNL